MQPVELTATSPAVSLDARRVSVGLWSSLLVLAAGHMAVDLCTGVWPVYKTMAKLDLSHAGVIAAIAGTVGQRAAVGSRAAERPLQEQEQEVEHHPGVEGDNPTREPNKAAGLPTAAEALGAAAEPVWRQELGDRQPRQQGYVRPHRVDRVQDEMGRELRR